MMTVLVTQRIGCGQIDSFRGQGFIMPPICGGSRPSAFGSVKTMYQPQVNDKVRLPVHIIDSALFGWEVCF